MRANLSICVAMLILVSGVTSALTLEQFSEQCTIKSLEAARAGQYPLSICLASSVPSAMDVRKGYPVSLVICNASSVTWQPQNVSLVQANNVNWGTEAKTIPLDSPLSPGKAKLLTFNVTSPSKPGSYPATWSFRYNYNGNLFGASCGNPKVNVSVLPNKPPAFVGIPGITLQMNSEGGLELIDLYEYLSDDKIANESLTLSVSNQTDSSLIDCFINSDNRHLACYPPATGRTGTNQLTLTAIDNGGLVGTYYANVNVAEPDPTGDNSPPEIRAIEPITINIDASN